MTYFTNPLTFNGIDLAVRLGGARIQEPRSTIELTDQFQRWDTPGCPRERDTQSRGEEAVR